MTIVLYQPSIPQNTGNIVRSCHIFGANLLLIPPLGFSISHRMAKRSGIDYWNDVDVQQEENLEEYLEKEKRPFYFFSSKASKALHEVSLDPQGIFIFGNEKTGLPDFLWEKWPERFVKIAQKQGRCLNLSNACSIVLYKKFESSLR